MQTTMADAQNGSPVVQKKPNDAGSPGALGLWLGMMLRPRRTLKALGEARRGWAWVPALMMVGISVLLVWVRARAVSWHLYQDQLAYYTQHPEYKPMGDLEPIYPPIATLLIRTAESLTGLVGSWLLWGAGLILVTLLSGQGQIGIRTTARLVLWSWLPYLVRGILQTGAMLVTRDPIFNPGLSGLLVDNTPPPMGQFEYVMVPRHIRFWATVSGYVDIYLVWHLCLLWLGLPRIGRLSHRIARIAVLSLAILWIMLSVAIDFAKYKY